MNPDIGILGWGRTAYEKKAQTPLINIFADAARRALENAGVSMAEIDGIGVGSFQLHPDNAVTLSEQFGISPRWAYHCTAGSGGPIAALLDAIRAIDAGKARYVLILAGDAYDPQSLFDMMDKLTGSIRDYLTPHGFGGPNGLFALITQKHMTQYGTTREQLGRICVDQRANARLNDHALLRDELTMDDYLTARPIADPLRLFDCVLACSGAEAIVVGPVDRAARGKAVRVIAGAERYNYPSDQILPTEGGWTTFRDALWVEAGVGPADMDCIQLYDDYPIMVAIQLEDLGFCDKGTVGSFLERNSFTHDGSLPLNTGGGQLSVGQAGMSGGLMLVTEAVQQLRREGGPRQVARARRALASGFGMIGYGRGLAATAVVLEGTG